MCATFSAAAVAGCSMVFAACLLVATPALAQDAPTPLPHLGDVMHKGLVGKALDAVPMDPEERVTLQRTSAVVNGTLTGRSIAIWAGLAHPVLMVAGLVWGIYSALNIHATEGPKQDHVRLQPPEPVEASHLVARARED